MISKMTQNSIVKHSILAFSRILFVFFGFIVLSGCGYQCCPGPKGCFGMDAGRRPQVMATQSERIIDYNACFDDNLSGGGLGMDAEWVGVDSTLQESFVEKDPNSEDDEDSDIEKSTEENTSGTNDSEKNSANSTSNSPKVEIKPYRLSVGDLLDISILGEDESFVESAVVAPDGRLYYAFLNGIPAEGRTIDEISKDIVDKVGNIFVNPIVTISSKTSTSNAFKILGRVFFPGVYPLTGPIHLREAIGMAGGLLTESYDDKHEDSDLNQLANLRESFLLRDGKKVPVNFEALLFDPTNQQDVLLKAGDYVYIAPAQTEDIYVMGAVRGPQRIIYRRGMTLTNALSVAGGWNFGTPWGADIHRVLIIRGPLECPCAFEVDLTMILSGEARDVILQPCDIVYMHNKKMRFGRLLVRIAIDSFLQSFVTAAAGHYGGVHWFSNTENFDSVIVE